MSALEQWLMDLLLEHNVRMLRAEAEIKAKVIGLLILMQKDLVSLLANAPDLSAMGKVDKLLLLRESNALIADYYGRAQLEVDLFGVGQVESLGVRAAIAQIVDERVKDALAGTAAERAAAVAKFTEAEALQARRAERTAAAARSKVLKEGGDAAAADAAAARALKRSMANAVTVGAAPGAQAGAIEIRIGTALPTEGYLRTLAGNALIQGSPAKDWWARQEKDTAFKLANQIRTGAALGETNAQIIARIVGTDEVPGVMPITRKNAAAIVQTSMQTIAAEARRAAFELNSDLMLGIEQVSTLDGHTSLTCIAYSGAQWDMDYEPMGENDLPYNGGVPRHWGCRSTEIAVMKTFRDLGVDLDEPAEGTRASSDGQISAKTTFADYLKLKGEDYQNEVLGPGRAQLFREGKLSPRDLVDMKGRPLKLSALMELYSQ